MKPSQQEKLWWGLGIGTAFGGAALVRLPWLTAFWLDAAWAKGLGYGLALLGLWCMMRGVQARWAGSGAGLSSEPKSF